MRRGRPPGFETFRAKKIFIVVRNGLDLNYFRCSNDTSANQKLCRCCGIVISGQALGPFAKGGSKSDRGWLRRRYRLRIAGDGPLRLALEKLAEDLGISQAVDFHGAIHRYPSIFGGAKFLVHTSESEGCPNVVMEAMACGLPVVAMEAGDIPYLD